MQPEPIRPTVPSMTLNVIQPEQLAAFEDRIVDRITEALTVNWLPRHPLTPDELAAYLSVHRETLRRWTTEGALTCWQHGNTILYLPDDVAAFLGRGGAS